MVEIKRDRYLQQLIESRQNGLVKVVTGIRRCGKSYLRLHPASFGNPYQSFDIKGLDYRHFRHASRFP